MDCEQLTKTIDLQRKHGLPFRCFFDKAKRDEVFRIKWDPRAKRTPAQSLRRVINGMLVETEMMWRFFHRERLVPVATQTAVAYGRTGTCVDVVVHDPVKKQVIVVEVKRSVDRKTPDAPTRRRSRLRGCSE